MPGIRHAAGFDRMLRRNKQIRRDGADFRVVFSMRKYITEIFRSSIAKPFPVLYNEKSM